MRGDIETYHQDGTWQSKVEGTDEVFGAAATKDDAVHLGRERAKADKVEHFIRNLDGRISERSTYGHDPRNIPG
ncbi:MULTISPECIES: DUF2188 domain-containing protein [unclassified Curtobacterium]|uniref:DUF2188 domain-containing protein n=1 Tax=unclassified Curtobacterium TaxID=257496 RepID=UPI000D834519|nr:MULTISPECIES: DUF2188 domain-containing protein [unclassified Curtobacterium]PYY31502.1 DUF2188 domain-containing protein [Curtobacterium sp. MCBD17_030]PZE33922.1 DUF2188 domain-containing protein [Curtobacterium sp. MCPF17_031]